MEAAYPSERVKELHFVFPVINLQQYSILCVKKQDFGVIITGSLLFRKRYLLAGKKISDSMKEKNALIWKHVREEEDMTQAKIMIADGVEEAIRGIYEHMDGICCEAADVKKEVFGNGDPADALVTRVKVLEKDWKNLKSGIVKLAWGLGIPLAIAIMWALIRLVASGL